MLKDKSPVVREFWALGGFSRCVLKALKDSALLEFTFRAVKAVKMARVRAGDAIAASFRAFSSGIP